MKRYVREFANDLKRSFTPLANPRIRDDHFVEIDHIVSFCECGKITEPEAVRMLCKLMSI